MTRRCDSTQVKGSAELSRQRVKQYFAELHEQITRQEKAALVVVESHIRERLCMLKQQQEDMAILLSQISSVCQQCDKTIQQVRSQTFKQGGDKFDIVECSIIMWLPQDTVLQSEM